MQDHRIIGLIKTNNNDKALVALYGYFPMMKKIVLSKGGNTQDAEDIFQEALIVLCRKIKEPGFKLTAQLSTYLFSVCRFLWKDELKKRNHFVVDAYESDLKEADEYDIHKIVEEEREAKLAETVLNNLGERCRELLLLFYNTGLKLKDIALRMGYSSENTAKNQKYKCLEAAKNRLKELKQSIQTF